MMLPANREAEKVGLEDVCFYWVQFEVKVEARPSISGSLYNLSEMV